MVNAQYVIGAVVCTLTAGIVLGSEKQQPDEKRSSPEGLSTKGGETSQSVLVVPWVSPVCGRGVRRVVWCLSVFSCPHS